MNFKRRYFCLLSACCFAVAFILISIGRNDNDAEVFRDWEATGYRHIDFSESNSRRYIGGLEVLGDADGARSAKDRRERRIVYGETKAADASSARDCRMSNCFNVSMCRNGFLVHVHPDDNTVGPVSSKYGEILRALRASRYYTNDPEKACLFVLAVDTLDRDRLSSEYVSNIQAQIDSLKWWRGGVNHVVFNLYSGTWPDYNENGLGFNVGYAMLAKASTSRLHYRSGFDISFPLFHKELSFRGGELGALSSSQLPHVRKYLLSFKGKRYLTGIGSETRNSLYHIHNGQDIILLTTCKHGKGWKNVEDKRCEADNLEYDKWDYKVMLRNSTFCLVPRGRRLGSYRFLEVLQAACIPVVLSNDWVLPFSEVINWNEATVWTDERLLLQVPGIVRSVSPEETLSIRQQTQFLWETYFSSIEKIVATTLEIVKERVDTLMSRSSFHWNSVPGALSVLPEFSQSFRDFPFYWRRFGFQAGGANTSVLFTAVIYSTATNPITSSSSVIRLAKAVGRSAHLHTSVSDRLLLFDEIATDAVLSLSDDDIELVTDEVDFGLSIWQNHPERITGFIVRNHVWDDSHQRWSYTSKCTNDFSIVLTHAAFYHRYYLYLYANWLPTSLRGVVKQLDNCDDILFNFLVAHVIRRPPLKVSSRQNDLLTSILRRSSRAEHLNVRRFCVGNFAEQFGYMPLVRSAVRFEPHLFKDPVSILRKKYRHMEASAGS